MVVVVKTLFKHAKPHQLKVGFHIKGRAAKCLTNYNKLIINSNKVMGKYNNKYLHKRE